MMNQAHQHKIRQFILKNDVKPRIVKRQVVTKGGKVVDVEEQHEPTFTERLQAGSHLDKLSGDYDTAKHKADLQSQEIQELMTNTFTQDKSKLDRIDRAKDVTPHDPDTGMTGGEG